MNGYFESLTGELPPTARMPAIFVGHGSPLNAIADNPFTQSLVQLASDIPEPPHAILVVSAHWLTSGVMVQAAERPETIHDFSGFPAELDRIQYPAPGAPRYAHAAATLLGDASLTSEWGLDHGAWAVLRHIYPRAQIPVFQVSIDWARHLEFHFQLALSLKALRDRGVLILGSGNIVHNLRKSIPRFLSGDGSPFDWAIEFDAWVKDRLERRDFQSLTRIGEAGEAGALSVPSLEHYVPLLYTAAVADPAEEITQIHEEVHFGGISMRTFRIG